MIFIPRALEMRFFFFEVQRVHRSAKSTTHPFRCAATGFYWSIHLFNLFMCMCLCEFMCMIWVQVPTEARRGFQVSWNWSYRQLQTPLMLETEYRDSERAVSLNCWDIFLVPFHWFLNKPRSHSTLARWCQWWLLWCQSGLKLNFNPILVSKFLSLFFLWYSNSCLP